MGRLGWWFFLLAYIILQSMRLDLHIYDESTQSLDEKTPFDLIKDYLSKHPDDREAQQIEAFLELH